MILNFVSDLKEHNINDSKSWKKYYDTSNESESVIVTAKIKNIYVFILHVFLSSSQNFLSVIRKFG